MTDLARRRPPRRRRGDTSYQAFALVVSSSLRSKQRGDVFASRRHVWVDLTCGHRILRVALRQFLTGERMRCAECERRARHGELMLPFDQGATC